MLLRAVMEHTGLKLAGLALGVLCGDSFRNSRLAGASPTRGEHLSRLLGQFLPGKPRGNCHLDVPMNSHNDCKLTQPTYGDLLW